MPTSVRPVMPNRRYDPLEDDDAPAPATSVRARPPGAAPATSGPTAQVGSAARPSPNPTAAVRPAMQLYQQSPSGAQQNVDSTRARAAALTSVRPAGPGSAPGHDGIDVRSYTGSLYAKPGQPQPMATPGYRPQPTAEAGADNVLRAQFGAPPNERGQIDIARGTQPVRSLPIPAPIQQQPPAPQQTEAANPLTGDRTQQMEGTTTPVRPDPAQSMGFSQRGRGVPRGSDALTPDPLVGGTGLYARRFSSPQSAGIYGDYVRRLFGDREIAG